MKISQEVFDIYPSEYGNQRDKKEKERTDSRKQKSKKCNGGSKANLHRSLQKYRDLKIALFRQIK